MQLMNILGFDAKSHLKLVVSSLAYRYFTVDIQSVITRSGFFTSVKAEGVVIDDADRWLQ